MKKHVIVFVLSILPAFIGFGGGFGYWYLKEKKKAIIAIAVHLVMYFFQVAGFTGIKFSQSGIYETILLPLSPYIGIAYIGAWIYEIINCQLIARRKK